MHRFGVAYSFCRWEDAIWFANLRCRSRKKKQIVRWDSRYKEWRVYELAM